MPARLGTHFTRVTTTRCTRQLLHLYGAYDKTVGTKWLPVQKLITATTGTGRVPEVILDPLTSEFVYSGTPHNLSLSATATDADGFVQRVNFYVNGELAGSDTPSPYETSYDLNGSGMYEVYVVSDDDGNSITSTIGIHVFESTMWSSLLLLLREYTYLGGVADVSALYKSANGLAAMRGSKPMFM